MKIFTRNIKQQSGETIVEVLLAISILASALGISFATATRSGKGLQANRERYQAQLLANEQASLLKANAANFAIRTSYFCFTAIAPYPVQNNPSATSLHASCMARGGAGLYDVSISEMGGVCNSTSKFCTYKIHIEWDSVKGPRDNVEVFYAI